ncbi:LysR family substrate-binding domain-containing protein [Simplicispira suum]|uniref:LysR family substrate-binding domain-containing protein n=1 Tax=Simplicispira suum TaxID=2109915 RepID=UPI001FE8DEB6|nr:LysR family substrate-binding domain-containing protein [Simplicispira suum]
MRLFKESLNLFIRLERAQRVVRATDANHRAPLHIGVADGLAQPRLSQCLARWQAIAPEVPLELSEMRARELAAALCREEVDVGFSFGVPEDARIVQEPVWDYPLIALLPRGHELERQGALGLADLARFPMIVCHADHKPGVRRQIDALLAQCACAPSIAGEARTFMGCVTRIAAGLGVGVTDSGHAETLRRTDVSAVPLQGDLRLHTYVLYKHQRGGLPEAVQRFLTHTRSL